jgi:hypothetical protein
MTCSRCGHDRPNRGCYVCGESLHEPKNMNANTVTINEITDASDYFRSISRRLDEVADNADSGDINPRNATALVNSILCDAEDFAAMKQTPLD